MKILPLAFLLLATAPLLAQNGQHAFGTERIEQYGQKGEWHDETQNEPRAKNIIVVIGDGMGTGQVYASVVAQRGKSNFLRFPFSGFSCTSSNNKYTTDSGAGGTAIVGGKKTDNYHVGLSADNKPITSFLGLAHQRGLATGFVVTSSVLDATPASTYAHVPYRRMYDTISLQMAQCSVDVMIGGGVKDFRTENRKDGLSPLDTLLRRGYTITYTSEEMQRCRNPRMVHFFCEERKGPAAPERGDILNEGTRKALDLLSRNPNGFALMIEGSQIDWACHDNDAAHMEAELADFEKMLATVLDFAERDGNTLVVVTADHETGGLVLLDGSIADGKNECKYTTTGHSGIMVPVFAYGPGAERFSGIQQNCDLLKKILTIWK